MTEKTLSEKIKELFEIEYLDLMADVQGDVRNLVKESVKRIEFKLLKRFHRGCIPIMKIIKEEIGEGLIK